MGAVNEQPVPERPVAPWRKVPRAIVALPPSVSAWRLMRRWVGRG